MFTGIIETMGELVKVENDQKNLHFHVRSTLTNELEIDQSLAHDGVCLTVVDIQDDIYTVTAVHETLQKSALGMWAVGRKINLERAMKLGDRLDGHLVQGHVDDTGKCIEIENQRGSWLYKFQFSGKNSHLTIEKGSLCINGTSLTIFNLTENSCCVTVIPYTYEHTNFHQLNVGDLVNLEFDMIGKYISKNKN
jgi:riboflavin synthase